MRDNWKICYTAYSKAGIPLNENEQFTYANICAKTADEAIEVLKEEFSAFEVKTFGKPVHSYVYPEEYECDNIVYQCFQNFG